MPMGCGHTNLKQKGTQGSKINFLPLSRFSQHLPGDEDGLLLPWPG
jgi:hypothetical protein